MQEGRDQLQTVADPMIDLAQQHLSLGRERLEPIPRGPHLLVRHVALAPDLGPGDRRLDSHLQKLDELALDVFDQIVDRTCLESRDGNAALVGPRDVDDRRRIGEPHDLRQRRKAILPGHVVVERHDVDASVPDRREARRRCPGAEQRRSSPVPTASGSGGRALDRRR